MLFYIAFAKPPDAEPLVSRQPIEHPIGFRRVSAVRLILPHAEQFSAALHRVTDAELLMVETGPDYLLEVTFDNELQGRTADFRPSLPLKFRW